MVLSPTCQPINLWDCRFVWMIPDPSQFGAQSHLLETERVNMCTSQWPSCNGWKEYESIRSIWQGKVSHARTNRRQKFDVWGIVCPTKRVEKQGIEPGTSCMLSTRSTNWAISPRWKEMVYQSILYVTKWAVRTKEEYSYCIRTSIGVLQLCTGILIHFISWPL